jgi:hypothetical protein
VLIGLPLCGIVHKYKASREEEPLPISITEIYGQVKKLENLLKTS